MPAVISAHASPQFGAERERLVIQRCAVPMRRRSAGRASRDRSACASRLQRLAVQRAAFIGGDQEGCGAGAGNVGQFDQRGISSNGVDRGQLFGLARFRENGRQVGQDGSAPSPAVGGPVGQDLPDHAHIGQRVGERPEVIEAFGEGKGAGRRQAAMRRFETVDDRSGWPAPGSNHWCPSPALNGNSPAATTAAEPPEEPARQPGSDHAGCAVVPWRALMVAKP